MCLTASHPRSADVDSAIAARVALLGTTDLKRMFTAYDITRDVRAKVGRQVNVPHADIQNLVHAKQFDLYNVGYSRVEIPTPTGLALLYIPAGEDENEYVASINPGYVPAGSTPAGNVLPSPNTQPAVTNSISVSGSTLDGAVGAAVAAAAAATAAPVAKTQLLDAEYRLPIYADLLKTIGAEPGGTTLVYVHSGDKIEVCVPDNQAATPFASYTVNADGRIRISGKVLEKHLPSKTRQYNVTANPADKTLVITAA
jgi:hypothetical protein